MPNKKSSKKNKLICLCNSVSESVIREAIQKGAKDLGQVFDATNAGVGVCGGSCRPQITEILKDEKKKSTTNHQE